MKSLILQWLKLGIKKDELNMLKLKMDTKSSPKIAVKFNTCLQKHRKYLI